MNTLFLALISFSFVSLVCAHSDNTSLAPSSEKSPEKKTVADDIVDNRIAIVVKERPIFVNQIHARARLMRLSREPENTKKPNLELLKEAAQALVGEQIKRITCDRVKVTVPKEEIDAHIKKLAEQNGMDVASMEKFFLTKHIPIDTIRSSIYVQMAWPRAVQGNVQVIVSDQEAQKKMDAERASFDQDRVELGEIVIYGDSPQQLKSAQERLRKIADSIRKNTSFSVAVQQFSESASTANEGNIGWFAEGELKAEERAILNNKPVGFCSDPIPCSGGYRILYVIDRQYPGELPLSQSNIICTVARLPFSTDWSHEKQEIFNHMLENITQCKDDESFKQHVLAWSDTDQSAKIESLKPMPLYELPPEVARLVSSSQATSVVVGPLRLPNNQLVLVFIKSRVRVKGQKKSTFDQVQNQLYQDKVDTAALREFSHLRVHTPVEYLIPEFGPKTTARQA